jgi:hypothetical protein
MVNMKELANNEVKQVQRRADHYDFKGTRARDVEAEHLPPPGD